MGPQSSGAVELRAFRGTRRRSVYREHVLPLREFARIVAAARERGLGALASLVPHGPHEFDKAKARRLAGEAESIRRSAALLDLDDQLTELAEVARWCAHASGPARLVVAYLS